MQTKIKIIKSVTLYLDPAERWVANQNSKHLTAYMVEQVSFRWSGGQLSDLKIRGKAADGHLTGSPRDLAQLPMRIADHIRHFDWAAAPAMEVE